MSAFTATGVLARAALRRDRFRIAVWVLAIVALVWFAAVSTRDFYSTQAELDAAAATSRDNPAALAFNGPDQALDTIGGQVAFQIGAFGLTMAGLMSLFMTGRLTRGEEESGRVELLRSMPVGPLAPLAAAVVVVSGMSLAVGVLSAICLWANGLPVAGSLALGSGFAAVGVAFVGVTAVTAQVSDNPRVATGMAGGVLGASFALRAVGDIGGGTLSWLSPIGWAQKARPYAGERWWPLVGSLLVSLALVVVAARLSTRRDLGGGLLPTRRGPALGSPQLGHPRGLAWRLQRPTLAWWAVALFALGLVFGSLAASIEDFVADSDAVREYFARTGGNLTDAYLATSLLILAAIGAGFSVQSALRPRSEEAALRAEPVLATPVSRDRWLWSHLTIALAGSVAVLAAAGAGMGLAYAVTGGGVGQIPRLTLSSLVFVPAVWVFVGIAVATYGALPRVALAAWVLLGWCMVEAFFGSLLQLPSWLVELSPFERTPQVPAVALSGAPLVLFVVLAAALVAVGVVGLRRRDLVL